MRWCRWNEKRAEQRVSRYDMVLTKGGRDLPKRIPGLKLTKFDPSGC